MNYSSIENLSDSDPIANFSTTTSSFGAVHSTSMNIVGGLSMRTNSTTSFTDTTTNKPTLSSTIPTTTNSVRCPPPIIEHLDASGLLAYASCVKEQCQEMQKEVLRVASKGRIADCFVLLEGAGGCSGNASAQVAGLSNLSRSFDVGELCGPLCRSTHCGVLDAATSTSISQAVVETTTAEEASTSITTMPVNTWRVWKATLAFRVSPIHAIEAIPSVMRAVRDAIGNALQVSPFKVVIFDISIPQEVDDPLDKENQVEASSINNKVTVPFEILEAPYSIDKNRVTRRDTLTDLQVQLSQLLYWAGFSGTISSVNLEDISVEHRAAPTDRPRQNTGVDSSGPLNITVSYFSEKDGETGDSHGNRHFKVQFGVFAFAMLCCIF